MKFNIQHLKMFKEGCIKHAPPQKKMKLQSKRFINEKGGMLDGHPLQTWPLSAEQHFMNIFFGFSEAILTLQLLWKHLCHAFEYLGNCWSA